MTKRPLIIGIGLMMLITLVTYLNHFNNTFHFDDFHTILNNANIRSLKNIPRFFADGSTMSILPQNQAYRPVAVTSLALDYWLAGGNYASYFQTSTFILFLIQGGLMVLLFNKLFSLSRINNRNSYIALIAATWYMLHPANAETVNYIIARADVQSTLFVLLGFILYIFSPFCRKTFIYLPVVGIGILSKVPAVMFAPLLFFYILMFEAGLGLGDLFKKSQFKQVWAVFLKTLPAFIFCGLMYLLVDRLTPKTWEPGGTEPLQYLITQPFVILHYFYEFFLPTGLSADTDWKVLPSVWDVRFFAGCIFILLMLITAFYTSKRQATRPVSFGIIWFFLALLPTSSIIPLGEVLNDHRMYFPFVGLVMSVTWSAALLLSRYYIDIKKPVIIIPGLVLLSACVYGTYKRNEVWHSEESLWRDVSIKSPLNGRGLMNYGVVLIGKEQYPEAEKYLRKAMHIIPDYSFLYTNMGLIKEQEGQPVLAENYYKAGVKLGPNYPDPLYLYARFLIKQYRYSEAIPILQHAIKISPSYVIPRTLLMGIYSTMGDWEKLNQLAIQTLKLSPDNPEVKGYLKSAQQKKNHLDVEAEEIKKAPSAEKYTELSLLNYQVSRYQQCVDAAREAVSLNPRMPEPYNNMGIAYTKLKQYDKAAGALKKALVLKPGFILAKNNLLLAEEEADKAGIKIASVNAADYIELSLSYFNKRMFKQCIDACNRALTLNPNYDIAYNNICAAYNKLGDWDKAIAAGKKGLKINPNNQVLKNNFAVSIKGKSPAPAK
jgi:tetratricopeptide (TPR) repeat protein